MVNQAALADFLDEGLLARHVKKAMLTYERRRAQILDILRANFATTLTVVPACWPATFFHVDALVTLRRF
jgi:GntR family transcriptional regulator/MocR family aminotransferase